MSDQAEAAVEIVEPVAVELTPRERFAALDKKKPHPLAGLDPAAVRSEGEETEWRRLGERIAAADRLKTLRVKRSRSEDEDAELAQLQGSVPAEDMVA